MSIEKITDTVRYPGNAYCSYINETDATYYYGCEFEFYIHEENYQEYFEEIRSTLCTITSKDVLINMVNLPNDEDKDHCMQIKSDGSLKNNGVEISIPICSRAGVEHYIKEICGLVERYGYTNIETGLHFHISTVEKNGVNFNFYKFMLLCNHSGILSGWETRAGYSHNVMEVLSSNTKAKARSIKNSKGTIWNLEKIDSQHVEIRSIGGKDYHSDVTRLIKEFHLYADFFDETLGPNTDKHKKLFKKHAEEVEKANPDTKKYFAAALSESGIY